MRTFLLSRLAQTVLVVFLSLTAVFFLVRLGGDPVLLFLPMDIQAKDVNEFRQRLGLRGEGRGEIDEDRLRARPDPATTGRAG